MISKPISLYSNGSKCNFKKTYRHSVSKPCDGTIGYAICQQTHQPIAVCSKGNKCKRPNQNLDILPRQKVVSAAPKVSARKKIPMHHIGDNGENKIFEVECPTFLEEPNNLEQNIKKRFGPDSFSEMNFYNQSLAQQSWQIDEIFIPSSAKSEENILKGMANQSYLPLQIRKSLIPQAGDGVFATKQFRPYQLIIPYMGVFTNVLSNWPPSDSIYDIGTLLCNKKPTFIAIQPLQKLNGGRFVNTNSQTDKINAKMFKVLVRDQIVLLIVAIKQISPGEQIYYSYGENYTFQSHGNTVPSSMSTQKTDNEEIKIDSIKKQELLEKMLDFYADQIEQSPVFEYPKRSFEEFCQNQSDDILEMRAAYFATYEDQLMQKCCGTKSSSIPLFNLAWRYKLIHDFVTNNIDMHKHAKKLQTFKKQPQQKHHQLFKKTLSPKQYMVLLSVFMQNNHSIRCQFPRMTKQQITNFQLRQWDKVNKKTLLTCVWIAFNEVPHIQAQIKLAMNQQQDEIFFSQIKDLSAPQELQDSDVNADFKTKLHIYIDVFGMPAKIQGLNAQNQEYFQNFKKNPPYRLKQTVRTFTIQDQKRRPNKKLKPNENTIHKPQVQPKDGAQQQIPIENQINTTEIQQDAVQPQYLTPTKPSIETPHRQVAYIQQKCTVNSKNEQKQSTTVSETGNSPMQIEQPSINPFTEKLTIQIEQPPKNTTQAESQTMTLQIEQQPNVNQIEPQTITLQIEQPAKITPQTEPQTIILQHDLTQAEKAIEAEKFIESLIPKKKQAKQVTLNSWITQRNQISPTRPFIRQWLTEEQQQMIKARQTIRSQSHLYRDCEVEIVPDSQIGTPTYDKILVQKVQDIIQRHYKRRPECLEKQALLVLQNIKQLRQIILIEVLDSQKNPVKIQSGNKKMIQAGMCRICAGIISKNPKTLSNHISDIHIKFKNQLDDIKKSLQTHFAVFVSDRVDFQTQSQVSKFCRKDQAIKHAENAKKSNPKKFYRVKFQRQGSYKIVFNCQQSLSYSLNPAAYMSELTKPITKWSPLAKKYQDNLEVLHNVPYDVTKMSMDDIYRKFNQYPDWADYIMRLMDRNHVLRKQLCTTPDVGNRYFKSRVSQVIQTVEREFYRFNSNPYSVSRHLVQNYTNLIRACTVGLIDEDSYSKQQVDQKVHKLKESFATKIKISVDTAFKRAVTSAATQDLAQKLGYYKQQVLQKGPQNIIVAPQQVVMEGIQAERQAKKIILQQSFKICVRKLYTQPNDDPQLKARISHLYNQLLKFKPEWVSQFIQNPRQILSMKDLNKVNYHQTKQKQYESYLIDFPPQTMPQIETQENLIKKIIYQLWVKAFYKLFPCARSTKPPANLQQVVEQKWPLCKQIEGVLQDIQALIQNYNHDAPKWKIFASLLNKYWIIERKKMDQILKCWKQYLEDYVYTKENLFKGGRYADFTVYPAQAQKFVKDLDKGLSLTQCKVKFWNFSVFDKVARKVNGCINHIVYDVKIDHQWLEKLRRKVQNLIQQNDQVVNCWICTEELDDTVTSCDRCKFRCHKQCLFVWYSTSQGTSCPGCRKKDSFII